MQTIVDYFGAAYLVNLPERVDRLRSARAQLARAGLRLAPDCVQLFRACRFEDRGTFPNIGARGCFHSHLQCFRSAPPDCRGVLMFEDDIALTSALPRITPAVIQRLEADDWDFVFFGHEETGDVPRAPATLTEQNIKFEFWNKQILTTHFYGVSRRVIPRLIAHLERLSAGTEGDDDWGPMPLDGAFTVFRRNNPDVRCLIVVPKLGWQRPSRSDIMPKAFDNMRTIRPVISALRDLKHWAYRLKS